MIELATEPIFENKERHLTKGERRLLVKMRRPYPEPGQEWIIEYIGFWNFELKNLAGLVEGKQEAGFPIKADSVEDAFLKFDAARDVIQSQVTANRRKAYLMQKPVTPDQRRAAQMMNSAISGTMYDR